MSPTVFALTQGLVEYGALNARGVFVELKRQVGEIDPIVLVGVFVVIVGLVWLINRA